MAKKFKIAVINENGEIVGYVGIDKPIAILNIDEYVKYDNIKDCIDTIKRMRDFGHIDASNEFAIFIA